MTRKPAAPEAFGEIGAIGSLLAIPCTPSIQVWISTLVPASALLFKTLLTPVWKQDIKLITGKSWLKNLRQVVADAESFDPSFAGHSTEFLFEVAEIVDESVWWLFIGGLALEFLFEWTTLAYKAEGCKAGQRGRTIAGINPFGTNASTTDWAGALWQQTTPVSAPNLASAFVVPAGNSGGTLSGALTAKGLLTGVPIPIQTRVISTDTGEVISQDQTSQQEATDGGASILHTQVQGHFLEARGYEWQWRPTDLSHDPIAITQDGRITFTYGDGGTWF